MQGGSTRQLAGKAELAPEKMSAASPRRDERCNGLWVSMSSVVLQKGGDKERRCRLFTNSAAALAFGASDRVRRSRALDASLVTIPAEQS